MTGEYKFDNYSEKLDEVEYDNCSDKVLIKDKQKSAEKRNKKKMAWVSIMMQICVIVLLLLLIGLTSYNIFLQQTNNGSLQNNCEEVATMGDDSVGQEAQSSTKVETATTEIQEILKTFTNNVIQLVNSSSSCYSQDTSIILETLQEIQHLDDDFHTNISDTLTLLLGDIETYFTSIISTLSNHRDITITTATVVDDILIGVDKLLEIHNASALYNSIIPVSCKDIKAHIPDSPSGYYHVNNRDIYCNMEELCDSSEGWTRIAYLDMTDSTQTCPDGLQLYQANGVRSCGRKYSVYPGCSSPVKFSSTISYTEICGRVTGYQYDTSDAVSTMFGPYTDDINSFYLDGVSLTRGSPRQHVWSFVNGLFEDSYHTGNCPCNNPPGDSQKMPAFVGDHYFCESGCAYLPHWPINIIYTSDPLWDGKGCGIQETDCCLADGLPWFHREYDNATTDFIEMRLCDDEGLDNEGTYVPFYEIYVK